MRDYTPRGSGLTGLVLVLLFLLAPVEMSAQQISSDDRTLRSVIQPCLAAGHSNIFPPSYTWNDRIDVWLPDVEPGEEYRTIITTDAPKMGTFSTRANPVEIVRLDIVYETDGTILMLSTFRSSNPLIIVHSPQNADYTITVKKSGSSQAVPMRPALGELRGWVYDKCGN